MTTAISIGWPDLIGKMSFLFPQVFSLISDRSVWHNGKPPVKVVRCVGSFFANLLRQNGFWSIDYSGSWLISQGPIKTCVTWLEQEHQPLSLGLLYLPWSLEEQLNDQGRQGSFIWGHHHLHIVGLWISVNQLNTSQLATPCWRDPTRSKQLSTVAIWLSVWTLSCRCPVKLST